MEINYNLILEYLCNQKDLSLNSFSNKVNIIQKGTDFNNFKNIFDENFYRYGVNIYNDTNDNISLYSSLLFCLDSNILLKDTLELFNTVSELKLSLINSQINLKDLDIDDDINLLVKNNENSYLLEVLVNMFKINIIIFDFKDNKIKSVYDGKYFNPWKLTIYLANYENFWEPIISSDKKYFSISNDVNNTLKNKILFEDIEYFNDLKAFTINDNLEEILEDSNLINYNKNKSEGNVEVENDTFISHNNLIKNFNKSKLSKLKKDELIGIMTNLNINLDNKKAKKQDIVNIICDTIGC